MAKAGITVAAVSNGRSLPRRRETSLSPVSPNRIAASARNWEAGADNKTWRVKRSG